MPFTRIAQHSLVQKGSRAETADIAVAERLARGRRHGAMQVAGTLSEVGDQPPLLTLSGAVLALGLATGNAQRAETGARMLAAVLVATGIKSVLKHFVSRTRPHVLLDQGRYAVQAFGPNKGPWQSFPSGHTAGSVAAARALARAYPGASGPVYAGAAAIALVQLPRGKHYPSDVVAGAVVGVVAEAIVDRAAVWLSQRLSSASQNLSPRAQQLEP
jgi:hypothetical protein